MVGSWHKCCTIVSQCWIQYFNPWITLAIIIVHVYTYTRIVKANRSLSFGIRYRNHQKQACIFVVCFRFGCKPIQLIWLPCEMRLPLKLFLTAHIVNYTILLCCILYTYWANEPLASKKKRKKKSRFDANRKKCYCMNVNSLKESKMNTHLLST